MTVVVETIWLVFCIVNQFNRSNTLVANKLCIVIPKRFFKTRYDQGTRVDSREINVLKTPII